MTGSAPELLRKEVCAALVHCIVSNRGLWETVDISEAKRRMEPALASLPWRPLSLLPLWSYFLEVGTPEVHARETLLFFASRGVRWGIAVDLPAELNELSAEQRSAHVERMRSLGGSSGTFVGRAPVAPLQGAPPRTATPLQSALPRTATPHAIPVHWDSPSAPATPTERKRERTEPTIPMPAAPRWPHRAPMRVVLAAAAALGVMLTIASVGPGAPTPRHDVALGDLCSKVVAHGHALLCTVTPAAYADANSVAIRVEAIRIALDATVIFVDDLGNVVDPIGRPARAAGAGRRS